MKNGNTNLNTNFVGLSEQEVNERRQRGQGNNVTLATSRSYGDIIRHNVFNLINIILFSIGGVMVLIGRVGDAAASAGIIAINSVIGVYQEIRAKRQLDEIAVLTRPKVKVIREAVRKEVDPAELVLGDVVIVEIGDQIVVDGKIMGDGRIEVDESLLTGEVDPIPKTAGDEVLSGSFCVAGSATIETVRVGSQSFANRLTADARKFQVAQTPLQREINLVLRLLMLVALFLGLLMVVATILAETPLLRQVQMAAVIAGVVPNGLLLLLVLAYAMGATRIARQGVLAQQANAVESLSNITILCTDKTGTLTANRIAYHDLHPIGVEKDELARLIGNFARSASATNKTSEAIIAGVGGLRLAPVDEVPFSSALKWSALAFDNDQMHGVYVLGALEMLQPHLEPDTGANDQAKNWSDQGMRVLAFAHNPNVTTLHGADSQAELPPLTLLGLISFVDELRPHLVETLDSIMKAGIGIKVISGDNPQTVAALARQAGLSDDLDSVAGTDLAAMSDLQFDQAAAENSIFGRITPDQKERLVDSLKRQGHYVAMIGDGVNDVLSLKKADLGVAMESGNAATRTVADMILLNDSFAALPSAFAEGQRIINGMRGILGLFLTRALYVVLLIIGTSVIGLGFPLLPKHNALLVILSIGIPSYMLALWARPDPLPPDGLLRSIAHFVAPAAIFTFLFGMVVYVGAFYGGINDLYEITISSEEISTFQEYFGIDYSLRTVDEFRLEASDVIAQSALTTFSVLAGLGLFIFVEPPTGFFAVKDEHSGDRRPIVLAGLLFLILILILMLEPLSAFFEIARLPSRIYVFIAAMALVWLFVLRTAWRQRWLERFLTLDTSDD